MTKHPLTKYREENGDMSKAALARLLGVHKPQITRWENGQRSPRRPTAQLIAEKTGISPAELMGLEPVGAAE